MLHEAHGWIEDLTIPATPRFKAKVAAEYGEMVYNGQWFSPLHQDLAADVAKQPAVRDRPPSGSSSTRATSSSPVRSRPNRSTTSPWPYPRKGDQYNHDAAIGFISIYGLSLRNQAQTQLKGNTPDDMLRSARRKKPPSNKIKGAINSFRNLLPL